MANDEINVPSLVLILVVSGFIIRHFFFRGSPPANGARGSSEAGARGAAAAGSQQGQSRDQRRAEALDRRTEAAVEQIQQIFPYADRREVWWDLRRNGVNVAATTERILAGRLDSPPVTFQPPTQQPRPSTNGSRTGSAAAAGAAGTPAASKSGQPSLIQRYNLESKVAELSGGADAESSEKPSPSGGKSKNWSTNRDERQTLLKKRRDDMILEARRKMEAKIAAEKAKTAEGAAAAATGGDSASS
ncbi:coupling of ubiquitin conjugation to ER degradation protein 1 [Sporothrix brasiliensis 5110]|uniref:Coupling of ubiquitin conjugation to ER degradation protein 1 n=1 Tax=Sporothrix brasiliensis 5110 TaxID=1398154 RepID=A0A0C2IZ07_9PEZI|nr:coupling of ubiquitin conjugation to ER degradation protein 1 [Sporothrix brasiliensis 5110]KIH90177.1 coupling of ubiquitin conjugation to ER degradation protein 1 [Sporothrix brasiliensis 5110]